MIAYEKSSPTKVTWHNSHVTNEKRMKKSLFYMTHGYQNRHGDGLWHWATTHKVAWFFDHVIIGSFMTIKNVISPIPQVLWAPNLTGWWLMTWSHHPKNHIMLSKKFLLFIDFFYTSNEPLIVHKAPIRLLLLVRQ